jgi:hypothetical protein
MDCINHIGLGSILGIALFAGCSGSASPDATTATSSAVSGSQQAAQVNPALNPIAQAASEWLDAVLKGDTQRASARLTPQAMHRIIESKMTFSPPGAGVDTEGFRIGEIRTPSMDQAIVQCVLDYNAEGKHHTEEMCCLLRHVNNDWRVSGIAFGTTADKPWTLVDFETGRDLPIPRQDMPSVSSEAADTAGNMTRPSPRTAQGLPATSPTADRR